MRSTCAWAALLLVAAACVSPEEHRRALQDRSNLQAQIEALSKHQNGLAAENDRLRRELESLRPRVADADWVRDQKQKLEDLLKRYEQNSPGAVPGVELVSTPEGLAFRVLGGVLFASGSNEVSSQGKATLTNLIATLKQQGKRIRVDGHTDDQPIVNSKWGTNLHLSVARSIAVAEFLMQSGLPAERVGVAGFGEHRPTETGKDDAARQKNRRVEILMLEQ
ncbi:MAG: OmpA family protein [Planctomycetes bacterium]|nr:OmpA family protein [Planctomycetota bacterium]